MRTAFICASIVAGLVGCGGAPALKAPPLVPVAGKVMLDGKPVESATVLFMPKGGTKGQNAYASTGTDGTFNLKYTNDQDGCPKGEYVVLISKLQSPDGKPIPAGQTAADVAAVDIIPPLYKDPEAPINSINIDGPKTDLVFDLKTR
ncbi:MAG TPA: hypothetical protein VM165_00750 [Planctomycetaceae bacterium]|nr:hypothetical protein [Planctomycetaceae bacterium]